MSQVAVPAQAEPLARQPRFSAETRTWVVLAAILCALAIAAFVLPLLAPHDPAAVSLRSRLLPPFWLERGTWDYPLGTDNLGRCILSRLLTGAKLSWMIALSATIVACVMGTTIGLVAGYAGGMTDAIIMRCVDTFIAFPGLLLILLVLTVLGSNVVTLVAVLAFNGWMIFAMVTRNAVLVNRKLPYVEAAEIIGCSPFRVIRRHIAPNLAPNLITLGVLEYARMTLAESAISFLGLGVQPPSLSWGFDVASGRAYLLNAWWLVTIPGLAIAATVFALNMLARWLRSSLNPEQQERRFASKVMAGSGS